MSTKVLVFESDSDFAQTLTSGLSAYDCITTVVDDGEAGISAAETSAPDLILLTIELPRMNGFSVCNKLKRNKDLKEVPLVLLSSEATEETFEQHKRLRTRADAYIHKPVTVDELVAKIADVVRLTKSGEEDVEDLEDIEEVALDDELEMDDASEDGAEPGGSEASSGDDEAEELSDETDEAFGNMMAPVETPAKADEIEMEDLELEEGDGLEIAAPEEQVSAPEAQGFSTPAAVDTGAFTEEIRALRAQIEQLEGDLRSAREATSAEADAKAQVIQKKDAEIELVEQELKQVRSKLESKEGAGTAREFLDLREQLNKKDKEILEIRDSLTSKEKEVIRLNEDNISLGRGQADLQDQVAALENTRRDLEKLRDALTADKEQASKRGDDFKAKSERLQAELDARTSELKEARETHENVMATRDAQEAAMRDDHATALRQAATLAEELKQKAVAEAISAAEERAAGEQEAALVAAAEEAKRAQSQAVASRELELKAEQDSKLAALHRANEESLRKLRAEHEHATEEASAAAQAVLKARETELAEEKLAALSAQKSESDAQLSELEERRAALEMELETRTNERDANSATIELRDQRVVTLEAQVASQRAEVVELTDKLAEESNLLAQARAKWSADLAALSAASEALESASEQIKSTLGRSMP